MWRSVVAWGAGVWGRMVAMASRVRSYMALDGPGGAPKVWMSCWVCQAWRSAGVVVSVSPSESESESEDDESEDE